MKKIVILSLFFVSCLFCSYGQSLSLTYNGSPLQNNGTLRIVMEDQYVALETVYLDITNNSEDVFHLMVSKNDFLLPETATSNFCFNGMCYDDDISANSFGINPGETLSHHSDPLNAFHINYLPNGEDGDAEIHYTFFNESNVNDKFELKVIFSLDSVSKVTAPSVSASLLKAYPNPASNKVTIQYDITEAMSTSSELVIMNIMGAIMDRISLLQTSNKLSVDLSSYPAGLYFYSIESNGKMIITKKLVVN